MTRKVYLLVGAGLLLIAAALFAWQPNSPATVFAQDGEGECNGEPCPSWIVEAWAGSGHADATAEAFRHWDGDDPQEVPASCAKCHSEAGYLDFLGADGSAAGSVEAAAPVDSVVSCTVCHNPVSVGMTSVTFPSGVAIEVGASARCMVCHQGRESGLSVANAVEAAGVGLDEPSADLRFINIHYFAAAASLYGSEAGAGFQYEGKSYQPKFVHVEEFDTCAECHNPHTLELKVNECATCHVGVESAEDLEAIRMAGSYRDYDGDGDIAEGIRAELEGLQDMLYQAMQAYARDVLGSSLAYDPVNYPYFFMDGDGDGVASEEEAVYDNAFTGFSPRLLQAAYNFQAYEKDPGAYAHNAKYYVQLMYDAIESLNEALPEPVDLSAQARDDAGHFDSTAEAFRHWDEDGEVPGSCSKCHAADGLPFFLEEGVSIGFAPKDALTCQTCHLNVGGDWARYEVTEVEFPSGAVVGFEASLDSNLCLNCHQGRESSASVDAAIARAGVGDDEVSADLAFRNVHYFQAGATVFGSEVQGAYQYEGKDYVGRFPHVPQVADNCVACHTAHELRVDVAQCTTCHAGIESVDDIRLTAPDYDGDGATEGVKGEFETMEEVLLAAIQDYAANTLGAPILYDGSAYPYWFADANGDGVRGEEDGRYASWSPTLLRAAYNYQYVAKDPGAFAHNGKYVAQILYDSIEAIGGDVSGMTRP